MTSNRVICTDYFKDKVDVRISLLRRAHRLGDVTPAGKGFSAGTTTVYQSGKPYYAATAVPLPAGRRGTAWQALRLLVHLLQRRE